MQTLDMRLEEVPQHAEQRFQPPEADQGLLMLAVLHAYRSDELSSQPLSLLFRLSTNEGNLDAGAMCLHM